MNAESTKDWIELAPGVRRKTVLIGERMMQVLVWFAKGAGTPEHAHMHEQLTRILSGKMRYTVAGEVHDLDAGDSIALRGNVPHAAEAIEETLMLDTFTPLREDLLARDAEHRKQQTTNNKPRS